MPWLINSMNQDVLYSDSSHDEFMVLLTLVGFDDNRNLILEEFRKRGYRRCFSSPVHICRRLKVFMYEPKTKAQTPHQLYRLLLIVRRGYHAMYFKTTWESEVIGIQHQDTLARRLGFEDIISRCEFNSRQEIPEDKMIYEAEEMEVEKDPAKGDRASSSGYGTKSSHTRLTKSENRGAQSSLGLQTMVSGEGGATGVDLIEEVAQAVSLARLVVSKGAGTSDEEYDKVQAWLESTETKPAVPDILTTEDLDRELGNLAEATVGREGGSISLRSYQIRIPPNAVETDTNFKFRISLEIDLLEYPQDLIPISLPLYCSPGKVKFSQPVSVKLQTWARKADLSNESEPIPVFVYSLRDGEDWECVKSTELTSTGTVEFDCEHFCVDTAFIKTSDAEKVMFALEHILFRDNSGVYTSCHFLSSDAFASSMLLYLEKRNEILHPPTCTSLVKPGDEVRINLISEKPDLYQFTSRDSCVIKIDKYFYAMNRRESFSFILTPKNVLTTHVDFTFAIGEKKFIRRDVLKSVAELPNPTLGKESADEDEPSTSNVSTVAKGFASVNLGGQARLKVHAGKQETKGSIVVHGPAFFSIGEKRKDEKELKQDREPRAIAIKRSSSF